MTQRRHRGASTGLLVVLAAAALGVSDQDADRGAEILAPFKRELMAALSEGMARGPENAIGACRLRAPEIAASLSRDGVRVGRTSQRLRNPSNAPPDWVAPLLDAYGEAPAERSPRVVALGDDRRGYVEPIFVQSLCLTCHGTAVPGAIAAKLAALYPEDQATGYREGDFRGLFWAEFPAAP